MNKINDIGIKTRYIGAERERNRENMLVKMDKDVFFFPFLFILEKRVISYPTYDNIYLYRLVDLVLTLPVIF